MNLFNLIIAQGRDYGWGHGPGMTTWGFGMGWVGAMMMAIFWVAVIVAMIFLIRWLAASSRSKTRGPAPEASPLEILKRRYARGEINKEEFEEKKRDVA